MGLSSLSLISLYVFPFILAFRVSNRHPVFLISLTLSIATSFALLVYILFVYYNQVFHLLPFFSTVSISNTSVFNHIQRGKKGTIKNCYSIYMFVPWFSYFRLFRLFGKLKRSVLIIAGKKSRSHWQHLKFLYFDRFCLMVCMIVCVTMYICTFIIYFIFWNWNKSH